ncbi:MAG TPA: transposase [Acidobacteriota bacterium]|nr:transposase [Acidobacteriota bacterium]
MMSLSANRLKRVGLTLALIGLLGVAYEEFGRHRDRRRYDEIGTSVNVGGRTLNISCLGQGSPTVVFDNYGHQSGYSWLAVQREVAKYTRACWYDRAGYGWSELGSSPRTFQSVASDLHALLRESGIHSPVVLVGAGDAASHIRVYHGSFPTEIGGIVLLDANDVDDPKIEIPDSEKGGFQRYFGTWASYARKAACLLVAIGSDRSRFGSSLEVAEYAGIAPVTERSGKKIWVHRRFACARFVKQSFHEFATQSILFCDWARCYYDQKKKEGKSHHSAIRALAYLWIRIIYRCWKDRIPYEEGKYMKALRQRKPDWLQSSPLNES